MIQPLTLIVIAQLFGTSLWFSANGVGEQLLAAWSLDTAALGTLTGAVQLGFISGTLLFAISGAADRFSASRLFLVCALFGALANLGLAWVAKGLEGALVFRFLTGFMLAGIYPIGMKLVVSWAPARRGEALGLLVGMLTLGTALPHLLRGIGVGVPWEWVVTLSSALACIGGLLIFRLGDGPHLPRSGSLNWGGVLHAFRLSGFRAAALGYFGHMWELYAFWTLVPLLVFQLLESTSSTATSDAVPLLSFLIVGIGGLGCVLAGRWSRRFGSAPIAALALGTSGLICLLYPWLQLDSLWLGLPLLLIWGFAVVADSAQFSALASHEAPPEIVGSALAIMNSIGFAISVIAIMLVTARWQSLGNAVAWLLLPGPILGLLGLSPLLRRSRRV